MTASDPRLDAIKGTWAAHYKDIAYADDIAEGGDEEVPEDYERHCCNEDGEDWPCQAIKDAAPADVAYLLSVAEAQAGQIAKVRELHQPVEVFEYDDSNRTFKQDEDGEQIVMKTLCTSCTGDSVLEAIGDCEYDGLDYHDETHWPCPTIAALAPEGPEQ
ncbi:hypothetical protein ASF72_10720 [Arthrobacter sp. Leaf141]|uniref:hypothetical protein n=1 Tax=Arthrobacter sp. Leaf141 TaxID=1736273 RepID=UPI0006FB170F|nr:hypothetical protein [Arthrobacter sp. Leaf141]KQR02498.1 hypothetical protein ASF72_10720 [Arthrobacter sp. Leaf141]